MNKLLISLFCLVGTSGALAQNRLTAADYERADQIGSLGQKAYYTRIDPAWVSDSVFWYGANTPKGYEYFLYQLPDSDARPFLDQEALSAALARHLDIALQPYDLSLTREQLSEDLSTFSFRLEGYDWSYHLSTHALEKQKVPARSNRYWGESMDHLANDPVTSPDGKWMAFIRDFNVFVKNIETGKLVQLSFDGAEGALYSSYIQWSSDAKKLATYKVRPHTRRYFYFVESSPEDQLQPKLHKREYLKPGDAVPIKHPALFDITSLEQIPIDTRPFENQYDLSRIDWASDSRSFTFDFNERGHQRFQVIRVDAQTGKTTVVVDERSDTRVEYINLERRKLESSGEMLWKSQRDGWFHLYLFDLNTGRLKRQLTSGEWVVRDILDVNETTGEVFFTASSLYPEEDPYHVHYCKINLNGKGFKDLTPENANHSAWYSGDKTYLLDLYSRVDLPPVFVLRDGQTGEVLKELEKGDISGMLKEGWKTPEVFSARGRDGKTNIWGIIYRPVNFDPAKSYPIVEYIYAGPGANYVPKSFRSNFWFSGLAELGFIVVQIDGMGTGNRSRAFGEVSWKNLKDSGFPDRIAWIRAAAQKYPYMDTSRVGLYGSSAGGQSTVSGLLHFPDFYKAGVASSGCYDNRMDKIWWNELWMGYPVDSSYIENSAVENAHLLKSELMLIMGEMDDNVDPASTMQLVNALIKADKEFELVVIPGAGHTMGGAYGERKRRDFFVKHLKHLDTPTWNK